MQFRQGDVFLQRLADNDVPPDAQQQPRDADGRIVLALGEQTGHAHAIHEPHAALLARGAERFLRVVKPVALRHEEHAKIDLPAGMYRVVIQREYRPEGIRTVAD